MKEKEKNCHSQVIILIGANCNEFICGRLDAEVEKFYCSFQFFLTANQLWLMTSQREGSNFEEFRRLWSILICSKLLMNEIGNNLFLKRLNMCFSFLLTRRILPHFSLSAGYTDWISSGVRNLKSQLEMIFEHCRSIYTNIFLASWTWHWLAICKPSKKQAKQLLCRSTSRVGIRIGIGIA